MNNVEFVNKKYKVNIEKKLMKINELNYNFLMRENIKIIILYECCSFLFS